ncbi:hypothetical protein AF72_05035 [Xylella taiwanensis]|uniref:Uncharacterized protein n=1 Tax=Xylella taiwanensis TaxID=1444770 RepID=Z9JJQ8_9GAMM|nr:hypothetical protein AF72_05035 [Xylella taiwanensis]
MLVFGLVPVLTRTIFDLVARGVERIVGWFQHCQIAVAGIPIPRIEVVQCAQILLQAWIVAEAVLTPCVHRFDG